jgi:hypothetical protein
LIRKASSRSVLLAFLFLVAPHLSTGRTSACCAFKGAFWLRLLVLPFGLRLARELSKPGARGCEQQALPGRKAQLSQRIQGQDYK